jgi:hypothetical protein
MEAETKKAALAAAPITRVLCKPDGIDEETILWERSLVTCHKSGAQVPKQEEWVKTLITKCRRKDKRVHEPMCPTCWSVV